MDIVTMIQIVLLFHFANCGYSSAQERNKTMFLVYVACGLFVTFWMMYV